MLNLAHILSSFSAPGDYTGNMQEFTFSPTQDRFTLTIAISDDDILELSERFFASAELVSFDAQSEITILDEDSKFIGCLLCVLVLNWRTLSAICETLFI